MCRTTVKILGFGVPVRYLSSALIVEIELIYQSDVTIFMP